jgi:hypothetical protein
VYPNDGRLLVGQAAIEYQRDEVPEARALLRQALAEPYTLPSRYRPSVQWLAGSWALESLSEAMQELIGDMKFAEARSLIEAELADDSISASLRRTLERMLRDVSGYEKLAEAYAAVRRGDEARAREILTRLAGDESAGPVTRVARDRLEELAQQ